MSWIKSSTKSSKINWRPIRGSQEINLESKSTRFNMGKSSKPFLTCSIAWNAPKSQIIPISAHTVWLSFVTPVQNIVAQIAPIVLILKKAYFQNLPKKSMRTFKLRAVLGRDAINQAIQWLWKTSLITWMKNALH